MSTGLECSFEEMKPGQWYYLLENWDAPKMSWDWREFATAYGPFPTQEAALAHLDRHHANPGGYSINAYKDREKKPDPVLDKCIAEAQNPETDKRNPYGRQRYW